MCPRLQMCYQWLVGDPIFQTYNIRRPGRFLHCCSSSPTPSHPQLAYTIRMWNGSFIVYLYLPRFYSDWDTSSSSSSPSLFFRAHTAKVPELYAAQRQRDDGIASHGIIMQAAAATAAVPATTVCVGKTERAE